MESVKLLPPSRPPEHTDRASLKTEPLHSHQTSGSIRIWSPSLCFLDGWRQEQSEDGPPDVTRAPRIPAGPLLLLLLLSESASRTDGEQGRRERAQPGGKPLNGGDSSKDICSSGTKNSSEGGLAFCAVSVRMVSSWRSGVARPRCCSPPLPGETCWFRDMFCCRTEVNNEVMG